jgi:hypothetical protein
MFAPLYGGTVGSALALLAMAICDTVEKIWHRWRTNTTYGNPGCTANVIIFIVE